MKRKWLLLSGVGLLLITLSSVAAIKHVTIKRYERAFKLVAVGATESALLQAAGPPSYVTDGTRWVEPTSPKDPGQLVQGCVRELWYDYPWLVRKDAYCFSGQGVLLEKYNWSSW
jgi:hypothetical protein